VKSIRDLIVKNPVGHLCDVVTGNMVDSIICPSSDLVRPLKCCLLNEEKIHVVPNGIDPKKLDEIDCGTASLDKYSIEKENFILYIGRLYALKGVEYLIKAFKSIKQDNPRLKLVVAGSGDYEPYLRRVAQGTDGILFLGYVGSPITKKLLYKNCLTVVVPSIYETFPMVVLEAMAYGRPVVGSDVGGIRSLIRHGKNGFLVRPKNVGELGIFINRLYEDSTLRERMGMFGRSLVEKEFTVDKMTSETMKVYNSLL
jgi:glycosyltransferase involved in cell wall biosynthesis